MATPNKVNWLEAKKDYLADPNMSYEKLAKKYNIAKKTVQERGTKGGWVKTRQSIAEKADSLVQEKIVDELAQVNIRHGQTYQMIQRLGITNIGIILDEVEAEKEAARLAGVRLGRRDILSGKSFSEYASGMKTVIDGERVTKNLPTSVTKTEAEMRFVDEFSRYSDEELEAILDDEFIEIEATNSSRQTKS